VINETADLFIEQEENHKTVRFWEEVNRLTKEESLRSIDDIFWQEVNRLAEENEVTSDYIVQEFL
jgi:hypothetical protein